MKLSRAALAAAFALGASPALAATGCAPPPEPPTNHLPPKPVRPAGVGACTAQRDGKPSAACSDPAVIAYNATLGDWWREAHVFQQSVQAWQARADAYSTCLQAQAQ